MSTNIFEHPKTNLYNENNVKKCVQKELYNKNKISAALVYMDSLLLGPIHPLQLNYIITTLL